jgi:spore coat polysaccharide biosynthesis protein SpsF
MGLTGAIVQARMSSRGVPRRPLAEVGGQPLLYHIVERIQRTEGIEELVVAATTDPADKVLVDHALALNVRLFRGHPLDVLDRFYNAALAYELEVVVRLTCDCAFVDPGLIDRALEAFRAQDPQAHYLSNTLEPTFPKGLEIEVIFFPALEAAWREARAAAQRTLVTPYIRAHPERFHLTPLRDPVDNSWLRLDIDSEADLAFTRRLWDELGPKRDAGYAEIVGFLRERPELLALNDQRLPS